MPNSGERKKKPKNIAWYGPNMKEPVIKRTGAEGQVPE
jgi:serine/threonine protein kinase HipA of HipAB toxin-antitoxin module